MKSAVLPVRTLGDSVVEALRNRLLAGEFETGARLSDVELADVFGVSRPTVRGALKQLCHEGLVDGYAHRGFFVAEVRSSEIVDLLSTRAVLEAQAAASAVAHAPDAVFSQLEDVIDQIGRLDYRADISRVRELDIDFHSMIVGCAERPILIEVWTSLNSRISLMERVCRDILKLTSDSAVTRHLAYVDALRTRKPEIASRAAEDHYRFYIDQLSALDPVRFNVAGVTE